MDYEQKYKEAFERARNIHKYSSDLAEIKRMEYIFPELAESEDEKIIKEIISIVKSYRENCITEGNHRFDDCLAWLEKQGKYETDCHSNHQDANHPNGCITLEDFNGGEGFYKVHLDYLNEKQVEEIEEMIRTWNKESKYPMRTLNPV